jgi:hypothetical protein
MASLRKRLKSDNWVCCYAAADGRRTQRSTGTTDKDEAMAICRRWENEEYALRDNGEPVEGLAVANKRALVAGLVSVVIVILSLVGYWQYEIWKNGPKLFVDVPESERPATFSESNLAKRHRWVKLSPDALERLNTLGGKIRLNLFDDLEVTAEVAVRRFINHGSETSVGRLDNDPDTLMVMCRKTIRPGKLMGVVVDTFGTQYLITHEIDGKHVIVEVDPSKIPPCGGVIDPGQAKQPKKTAATKPGLPATQVARQDSPEAKALQRLVHGSEAQGLLDPSGHAHHRANATCRDCQSFAELKKQFKKVELKRTPKTGALAPTPTRKGPSTEPVNTSSLKLLNSMSFNKPLLAAQSFGLWGRTGSTLQSPSPGTPGVLKHLRPGSIDYIDILFIYTAGYLNEEGGDLENMVAKITRAVELTNAIFSQSHIPLEVRSAGLTLARCRHTGAGDPILALSGRTSGPAWVEIQPPVRPIWDPTLNNNVGGWSRHYGNGAQNGVYGPLYTNLVPATLGAALGWIDNHSTSLIYGDQYWGGGNGNFGNPPANLQDYINLPETFRWTIVPRYDDSSTGADDGNLFTYGPSPSANPYFPDNVKTPEIICGPVQHPESSHALDGSQPPGTPNGFPGNSALFTGNLSHAQIFQYNVINDPTQEAPTGLTWAWNSGTELLNRQDGQGHGLATGSTIHFPTGFFPVTDPPNGILQNTDYYVRRVSATHVSLYNSWIAAYKGEWRPTYPPREVLKGSRRINLDSIGAGTIIRGIVGTPPRNYGQAYNDINNAGVVGIRMDQLTNPVTGVAGQRYPNLHGTYGDVNPGPVTSRADLVCILTEALGGNTAGLAQKYTDRNLTPGAILSPNLIGSTTRMEDVDFDSPEVLTNRDWIRNLSLQGQFLVGGYTFMHELGHVLGASHALGDLGRHPHDADITFSPYARVNANGVGDEFLSVGNHFMAWGSPRYQSSPNTTRGPGANPVANPEAEGVRGMLLKYTTIMGYPSTRRQSVRIPFYSSPHVFYKGEPTGRLRGMFLPPPLSPYTEQLYFDNARTITAVGHLAAFYRDSNGSGRPSSRTSVQHTHPLGRPADRNENYSNNPNQANAKGGNSGTAPAGGSDPNRPNTKDGNSGTAAAGGSNPNRPNTKDGNSGTAAAIFPKGSGGLPPGGVGLPPGGGPSTIPLARNPAVPNDHLEHAYKWGLTPDEEEIPRPPWTSGLRVWRFKDSTMTFSTIINGHNNGATREEIKENGLNQRAFHGKSVWWEMEWPKGYPDFIVETLVATTKGSTFDTTLGVMGVPKGADPKDSIHNRSLFFWNNNAVGGGGPFSTVEVPPRRFNLKPGDRIFFMVDGVGASSGKIRLDVKFTGSILNPE